MGKKATSRKTTSAKSRTAVKRRSAKAGGRSPKKTAGAGGAADAGDDHKAVGKAKKSRSPLRAAELRRFRQMLLNKRRELVGDMTGIEAEAFGADRAEAKGDISDHPADAGTDNFEQEFSLGLLESERMLLGEIDEALRRIENGTYGVCLGTGKPISKARLEARPWAPYGIEYARMVEKGLVRPGERIDEGDD